MILPAGEFFNGGLSLASCAFPVLPIPFPHNTLNSLVNGGSFRGIDFDCRYSECRCLFDQGTLDSRNSGDFDRTERNQNGYGSIDGARSTKRSSDIYCGKRVGAEEFDRILLYLSD